MFKFKKSRAKHNRAPGRSMTIEAMEDRKLFAADFMVGNISQIAEVQRQDLELVPLFAADIDLSDGVVSVQGTLNNDVITMEELPAIGFTTTTTLFQDQSLRLMTGTGTAAATPAFNLLSPRIKVTVAETDGDILETATFYKSLVNSFHVSAMNGNDSVRNDTDLPATIYGGSGADVLRGGTASDSLYGQAGNDYLYGFAGGDYLSGGDGVDRLYGHEGSDQLSGGNDRDYMYGGDHNDSMSGGAGDDVMYGNNGNDSMYGNAGNDTMNGSAGHDLVSGQDGNDDVYGFTGDDTLYGGDGNDYLSGYSGDDELYGGAHADTLNGGSGNDYLSGWSGNDTIDGASGNDTLYGGSGHDEMEGGSGNDSMYGGSGNDTLRGEAGNDNLYGESGRDNLYGGSGNDYLNGGSGDDGLYGGYGTDSLRGSTGDDRFLVLNDVPVKFLGITIGYDTTDTLLDKNSNDAKVNFQHGKGKTFNFSGGRWSEIADGNFTQAEIEQVDVALADLHHQVGNTKLLKRKDGSEITVERLGAQTDGNFNLGGVNSGSKITVLDATFNGGQDKLSRIMFHEVGHNWDNENNNWNAWKAISDWQDDFFWPWESTAGLTESGDGNWYYDSSAVFARNYGRTNPMEDFATYFAKVMMEDNGMSYPGSGVSAAKEVFMDNFFASLV